MKILVCAKRVPAPGTRINVTADGLAVDTSFLGFTTSPHEECAVEAAVQLVEQHGGTTTVLTVGPPEAEEQLRYAVSVGIGPGLRPSGGPPRAVDGVLMSALLADLLILAAIVYDMRTRGRPHPVYVIGGAILLAVQILRGPLSTTQWWYALADSLARLTS